MEVMKIKKPPMIEEDIDCIDDYPQYIQDFINKMKDKNLSNFYHNIKDIDIIPVSLRDTKLPYAAAEYNVITNEIRYRKNSLNKNIMHELLHVASRTEVRDRILCGFLQVNNDGYGIGEGLNEGYTALMDDRYFLDYDESKKDEYYKIYKLSKYICSMLDLLIGRDEMEEMYFNADLHQLFKILKQYSTSFKAYKFIINMDKLFKEADIKSIPNVIKVLDLYNQVMYFLSECFVTRANLLLDEKEINDEEYNKSLNFAKWLLDDQIVYFKVLKSKKMGKYINIIEKDAIKNIKSRAM